MRTEPHELQTRQDICRAQFLVALARGLTHEESVEALKYRAAAERLSIHAAALAVLSTDPIDEVLLARSSEPMQPARPGYLYAIEIPPTEEA